MSNALLTLTQGKQALTEVELFVLSEMEADTAAYDMMPASVKIAPGGSGHFQIEGDMVREFTATVALSQKIRGYWPGNGTGTPPICSSPNAEIGFFSDRPTQADIEAGMKARIPHPGVALSVHQDAPFPAFFECRDCPMDQWSSEHQKGLGQNGGSKACKEMRRLLLLIDGWALPALISLPPTSITVWDKYCTILASRKLSYFTVRTKFEQDIAMSKDGKPYGIVRVSIAGHIEKDNLPAVAEIRRQYRELVGGGLPVQSDEYEVVDAPAATGEEAPF